MFARYRKECRTLVAECREDVRSKKKYNPFETIVVSGTRRNAFLYVCVLSNSGRNWRQQFLWEEEKWTKICFCEQFNKLQAFFTRKTRSHENQINNFRYYAWISVRSFSHALWEASFSVLANANWLIDCIRDWIFKITSVRSFCLRATVGKLHWRALSRVVSVL